MSIKRIFYILLCCSLLLCLLPCGCRKAPATYVCITAEQAKELMDSEEGYIILDVRTQEEYDLGHIPGALLIPNEVIREQAEEQLTDKEQLILVYCRSGRRSKEAAQVLAELGYTNVKEFGGINDWPYQTTR
ncbi:MAG: rhodanese-like domain-containing protein [Clostridia bacterium]|nr:rhodanese-like domain-containing protein [Clostridia bacterium]